MRAASSYGGIGLDERFNYERGTGYGRTRYLMMFFVWDMLLFERDSLILIFTTEVRNPTRIDSF